MHACAHTYAARCTCVDWPTLTREGVQNACAIVKGSTLQDLPCVRMLARIPTQRDAHVLANSRARGWSERVCDRERVSASGLAVGAHVCAHTYAAQCTCADWPTVTRESCQNASAIVRESALQDLPS
eukprot:1158410-Pleurochrysis_carterae.AAC.1